MCKSDCTFGAMLLLLEIRGLEYRNVHLEYQQCGLQVRAVSPVIPRQPSGIIANEKEENSKRWSMQTIQNRAPNTKSRSQKPSKHK